MSKILIAAAGLSLTLASPAAAQSGFLKNLARQAAAAAIQNAAATQKPAAPVEGEGYAAPAQPYAAAEQAVTTTGPAPWPTNAGAPSVKYPSQLTFSAELEAEKKAFLDFSKVSCTACEGGRSYDAWAQHFIRLDGSYKAWEKKLGGLSVGEAVTWKGQKSAGTITVVSEEPVGGWACKQLRWELKQPQASATRPGLICNGRAGAYDSGASWTEVF